MLGWSTRRFLAATLLGKVAIQSPVSLVLVCAATRRLLPAAWCALILSHTLDERSLFAWLSAAILLLVLLKCLYDAAMYERKRSQASGGGGYDFVGGKVKTNATRGRSEKKAVYSQDV